MSTSSRGHLSRLMEHLMNNFELFLNVGTGDGEVKHEVSEETCAGEQIAVF